MKPVEVAVIPAAGLGTRFLPVTKTVPKELLPIVDRPLIDLVVEEAVAAGVVEVIVVSAIGKGSLDAYFAPARELEDRLRAEGRTRELELARRGQTMARVTVIHQGAPRGNGDAVLQARELVGDRPFLMLWGDDITSAAVPVARQLIDARARQGGGSVAGAMRVTTDEVSRYGVIEGDRVADRTLRVKRLVEKPKRGETTSDLAQVHGYVLEPAVFAALERTPAGTNGELWLADAVNALCGTEPVWAYEFEGERFDAGDRLGYAQAFVDAALRRDDLPGFRKWVEQRLRR
ncbi:MAG: sugar phosphate nucleotidyltransferase [Chloroflexota bacterium]